MSFYKNDPLDDGGGGDGNGGAGGGGTPPNTPGYMKCVNGKCVKSLYGPEDPACAGRLVGSVCGGAGGGGGGCPEGVGPKAYEGCPCGEAYTTKTGTCAPGYKFVSRSPWQGNEDGAVYVEGAVGTCHCQKAIDDWKAGKGKGLGQYQWPPELKDLYAKLMATAGGLLPGGFSEEAITKMFGKGFENVRGLETPARESLLTNLGREGMLGTGQATTKLGDLSWAAERGVSDVMRDVFLQNELQKRKDIELSNLLFGGGINFNTILEQLNAGRRGEGQAALALFLQYFMSLMNSWKS